MKQWHFHRHSVMETKLGLTESHVIIDREAFADVLKLKASYEELLDACKGLFDAGIISVGGDLIDGHYVGKFAVYGNRLTKLKQAISRAEGEG